MASIISPSPWSIAVVGAGALGSPMVWGMVRLSMAHEVRVIDGDVVERSNLPRQPWYSEEDVGQPKVEVLARAIGGAGSSVGITAVPQMLGEANARDLLAGCDMVLDGSDNWLTRRVIERWAWDVGRPWIFASALRWEGMTGLMEPGHACLRCQFGEEVVEGPRCFETGVVGSLTLTVAGKALAIAEQAWRTPQSAPQQWWLIDGWSGMVTAIIRKGRRCVHYGA